MFHGPLALFLPRVATGLEAFDGAADALDTLFDVAFFGKSKAQSQALLAPSIHVKWFANHEGYPLASYFAQQCARAQIARQTTPEVKPAHRRIDTHLSRPVLGNGRKHQIAFAPVDLA